MIGQTVLLLLSIATSAVGLAAVLLRTGRQFGVLETRIDGLHREMTLRFDAVDERFRGVDQRFDAVDERFRGVEQRFDAVDERFRGIDQRFDAVDERFRGIDQRLDGIDRRLERVDDRFDRVLDQLSGLRVDVARIGQRLDDHVLDPRAHSAA